LAAILTPRRRSMVSSIPTTIGALSGTKMRTSVCFCPATGLLPCFMTAEPQHGILGFDAYARCRVQFGNHNVSFGPCHQACKSQNEREELTILQPSRVRPCHFWPLPASTHGMSIKEVPDSGAGVEIARGFANDHGR